MVRPAGLEDVARALDMADAKRRAVAAYHPIFHRPAVDAREVQAPWFRRMIERDDIVTLVHDGQNGPDGFITAMPLPGEPLRFSVDDFVVARPALWSSVGRTLLDAARQEVVRRGADSWEVNCQPRDAAKRRMLVAEGLGVARFNMVNHDPLPATLNRLAPSSEAVRPAVPEDIDGAASLIVDQLTRYHELDPTFFRLSDWNVERERMRAMMDEAGSICLATAEEGTPRALLIATVIPRIPVYDPGGPVYFIQSFVASDGAWSTDGRALLIEAMRLMVERDAAMMNTFALVGDRNRTSCLEDAGLSVVTEYFREEFSG